MNKNFAFSIKGYNCSFSAPVEGAYVITNYYCPKELLLREGSLGEGSFSLLKAIVPQNLEAEYEFINDCKNIVNKANTISNHDVSYCLTQSISYVAWQHINRCGRLMFQDLLLYVDCYSYLLKAAGYSDSEIRRSYPIIARQLVDIYSQYVKDSHTLAPFQGTNKYKILCRLADLADK